jgi:hypothetical protein
LTMSGFFCLSFVPRFMSKLEISGVRQNSNLVAVKDALQPTNEHNGSVLFRA